MADAHVDLGKGWPSVLRGAKEGSPARSWLDLGDEARSLTGDRSADLSEANMTKHESYTPYVPPVRSGSRTSAFFDTAGASGSRSTSAVHPPSIASRPSEAETSESSSLRQSNSLLSVSSADMSGVSVSANSSLQAAPSLGPLQHHSSTSSTHRSSSSSQSYLSGGVNGNGQRWAGGFGSSLQTPSMGELSSAGSIRSRRNWDEFEGKPITPLPSPSVTKEVMNGVNTFDKGFSIAQILSESEAAGSFAPRSDPPSRQSSGDAMDRGVVPSLAADGIAEGLAGARASRGGNTPSLPTLPQLDTSLANAPRPLASTAWASSSPLISGFPANTPITALPTAPSSATPSKTMAFFGSSPVGPAPAPSSSISRSSAWAASTSSSPVSSDRYGADSRPSSSLRGSPISIDTSLAPGSPTQPLAARLTAPSRMPTLTSSTAAQVVGSSPVSPAPSARLDGLPATGSLASPFDAFVTPSAPTRSTTMSPETAGSITPTGLLAAADLIGSDRSRGSAFSRLSVDGEPGSEILSVPGRRGHSTRHVYGPSENATGSSLLPPPTPPPEQSLPSPAANGVAASVEAPAPVQNGETEEIEDEAAGRIGSFSIERTLGVGAFSRVVLARRVVSSATASSTASTPREQQGEAISRSVTPRLEGEKRPNLMTRFVNSTAVQRLVGHGQKDALANGASSGEENAVVALKMMQREPFVNNERMRVSWIREVEVLKHIHHPNIVQFISSFSTPKHHVLVLERIAGGELFDLLAQHHQDLAKREWLVRRLFGELANAVGWMHSVNLVHRDIKLENVILTRDLFGPSASALRPSTLPAAPLLKLTDFGLSRFIDPASPQLETRCGSEEYAAPELIIGKRYDGRKTDVWALGVVLYALLSGALPFLEDSDNITAGGGAREGHAERDAKQRKAHLLRIAKGDLRWPVSVNDACRDDPTEAPPGTTDQGASSSACPPSLRLVTPISKHIVARLLRRDANKRATAWEVWDDPWLLHGSFTNTPGGEASAMGEALEPLPDPRKPQGQAWLAHNARVLGAAPEIAHDD